IIAPRYPEYYPGNWWGNRFGNCGCLREESREEVVQTTIFVHAPPQPSCVGGCRVNYATTDHSFTGRGNAYAWVDWARDGVLSSQDQANGINVQLLAMDDNNHYDYPTVMADTYRVWWDELGPSCGVCPASGEHVVPGSAH